MLSFTYTFGFISRDASDFDQPHTRKNLERIDSVQKSFFSYLPVMP